MRWTQTRSSCRSPWGRNNTGRVCTSNYMSLTACTSLVTNSLNIISTTQLKIYASKLPCKIISFFFFHSTITGYYYKWASNQCKLHACTRACISWSFYCHKHNISFLFIQRTLYTPDAFIMVQSMRLRMHQVYNTWCDLVTIFLRKLDKLTKFFT